MLILLGLTTFWAWTLGICVIFAIAGIIVALVYYKKHLSKTAEREKNSIKQNNETHTKISPKYPTNTKKK